MIHFNRPYMTGAETEYIRQAVAGGKISGNGEFTHRYQEFFERRYGFGKCLLTTSCTDALEMAAILTGALFLLSVSALETPVPLLLTLYPPDPDPEKVRAFCASVTEVLYPHRAICMVESVSTDVICFYKKNYSNIVRGMRMVAQEESGMTEKEYRLVSLMLRNMKTRPQFFDTTNELRSAFYWLPVTMGSFLIIRDVTDEASREEARSTRGVEAVVFRGGEPKATF